MKIYRDGRYLVTVAIAQADYIIWTLLLRHDGCHYTARLV